MTLPRKLAVFFLAAGLFCTTAHGRSGLDDERIFTAVEHALQDARSLTTARIAVQSRDGSSR